MHPPSFLTIVLALCLIGAPASAQDSALTPPTEDPAVAPVETFDLVHENRAYRIDIYRLPAGEGQTTIPRAYVLDGDRLAAPLAGRLRDAFPRWRSEGVIIGVTRTDTAPDVARYGDADAAGLERFLIEILQPEINRRLGARTARQTLAGEGDAALFVLHMAAEEPEAFDAYVAHGPQLNRGLPEDIAPGRSSVNMSSVRWMGRPLDRFEALAVRFEEAGRQIQVDTSAEGWDTSDGVNALWRWIGPHFIPPPV